MSVGRRKIHFWRYLVMAIAAGCVMMMNRDMIWRTSMRRVVSMNHSMMSICEASQATLGLCRLKPWLHPWPLARSRGAWCTGGCFWHALQIFLFDRTSASAAMWALAMRAFGLVQFYELPILVYIVVLRGSLSLFPTVAFDVRRTRLPQTSTVLAL